MPYYSWAMVARCIAIAAVLLAACGSPDTSPGSDGGGDGAPLSDAGADASTTKAALVGDTLNLASEEVNTYGGAVAFNRIDDEYFVVWDSANVEFDGRRVLGRRVSAGGALVGEVVEIVGKPESRTRPAVAHDPRRNHYLVVWKNQAGEPGSPYFNYAYGRLVSNVGIAFGDPVVIGTASFEATLSYSEHDDEFMLTAHCFTESSCGMRAHRISGVGASIGGEIVAAEGSALGGQSSFDPQAGRYLLTWGSSSPERLMGRMLERDGSFLDAAFVISPMDPASGNAASTAYAPVRNRHLVVFGLYQAGGLHGQFIDPVGTLVGLPLTLIDTENEVHPGVSFDAVNNVFLVAWLERGQIHGQLFSVDGHPIGERIPIRTFGDGGRPRIAANTNAGGFLVSWPTDHGHSAQLIAIEN